MCSTANEHHHATFAGIVEGVDQQEVAADVAIAMPGPIASQGVVQPFGSERSVIGDKQCHRLFQPVHVVPAGMREALPVLEEIPGVVGGAR